MKTALENLAPKQQRVVREHVRGLLERSPAFLELADGDQRKVARALVDVVAFLSDPKAGQAGQAAQTGPVATALAGSPPPNQGIEAFKQFQAQRTNEQRPDIGDAANAGSKAFTELTGAVNFPEFVAGLINGVFNAIVDASIRQMEAYQKLLESVVKSVDQFASENYTVNQGRDYLADRFPNLLKIDDMGGQPRLAPTDQGEETGLAEVRSALGMPADAELDLGDEASEAELARRAQLEMAKLRQEQLKTMVLLGVNRIVVTNGLINAKVVVDVKTKQTASDDRVSASSFDATTKERTSEGGDWFTPPSKRTSFDTVIKSANETKSSDDQSIETKANLTGEVKINFKSETFPPEKLASPAQMEALNQRPR